MCMKKFEAEQIFFWQTYRVFNLAIFRQLPLVNNEMIVYFVKSTPFRAFIGSFQHFVDIYFSKSVCISVYGGIK